MLLSPVLPHFVTEDKVRILWVQVVRDGVSPQLQEYVCFRYTDVPAVGVRSGGEVSVSGFDEWDIDRECGRILLQSTCSTGAGKDLGLFPQSQLLVAMALGVL